MLLRFPFTDLTTTKRRPSVVVSPGDFSVRHGDVVVIPLTGRDQGDDYRLEKWQEAGLLKPSWLKPLIATVTESLVEKSLGVLCPEDQDKLQSVIAMMIDARFVSAG